MLIRQLFEAESSTFTYLLANDYNSPALIIDPVNKMVNTYNRLLKEYNLQLKYAIDTHMHADHITATGQLRNLTGCDIVLGEGTISKCATKLVNDGDKIILPGIELTAIATPGHTDDSYSFYGHGMVFTGDTLFIRGSGRTDFQSGSALTQHDSLFNKLLKLPENTIVYPGHDYNGLNQSTINEEKKFNPRLQVNSAKEYKSLMDNLNLPRPKLMDIALPANLTGGV